MLRQLDQCQASNLQPSHTLYDSLIGVVAIDESVKISHQPSKKQHGFILGWESICEDKTTRIVKRGSRFEPDQVVRRSSDPAILREGRPGRFDRNSVRQDEVNGVGLPVFSHNFLVLPKFRLQRTKCDQAGASRSCGLCRFVLSCLCLCLCRRWTRPLKLTTASRVETRRARASFPAPIKE
jgi:hypothetical protein